MRTLLTILGLLLLIAGLGVTKGKQIGMLIAFGKEAEKNGPPAETVSTMPAKSDAWEEIIPSIGTITSVKGVTVSNDAPGVVTAINFDSGANVVQGQVLLVLDSSVERAQLASAQARRELAASNEGRTRSLVGTDSLPKAQLDNDQALLKSSGADLDALAAQISRKVVRAPFSGRLGIRNVSFDQADLRDWRPEQTMAGAYALDVFHHVPPASGDRLLQDLFARIEPGGRFLLKDIDTAPRAMLWFTYLLDALMSPRDD